MIKKLLVILVAGQAFSQTPPTQWAKVFGGTHSEYGHCIKQTPDSGFILAGETSSSNGDISVNHGEGDAWLIKLNPDGTIAWEKTYGGSNTDSFRSILNTADGGFIAVGVTASNDGDIPAFEDQASRYWIVKLDSSGAIQWQKFYGGSNSDACLEIQPCPSGGYITIGTTRSNDGDVTGFHGYTDIWVVKIDQDGDLEWQKTLGGSFVEVPYCVRNTSDGGFIVSGYTSSSDGDITEFKGINDAWVIKLSATGNMEWQKTFGSSGNDGSAGIVQTTDNGYLVCAGTTTATANGDINQILGAGDGWLFKLDATGNIQWKKPYGGSDGDSLREIYATPDNSYVLAGSSRSSNNHLTQNFGMFDTWILKVDADGNILWQKSYGGSGNDIPLMLEPTIDNGFVFTNRTLSTDLPGFHGSADIWVVRLEGNLGTDDFGTQSLTFYPNPAVSELFIRDPTINDGFSVLDASGKTVISQPHASQCVNVSGLASGVYFLETTVTGKKYRTRFIRK